MGGKHLKRLRAEKSKVQLKKKKLPKGQNLTNTTFTVKKILAVEQLQKVDKDVPVSNWNVPLKDLLIRLNHYNFTSRLNGLSGVKELVIKYPEVLTGPSLKPLISRLLELISDEEHKIRITTIDLLSYLFNLMSPLSITAFHKILNLHLACAMTHRNASVQQDSLKLIDLMIKYTPEAIKSNFKSIIQNFLRILKSYLYESYSGVFSSGKSKQDLEKAKTEMLFRLYQLITTGYSRVTEQKQSHYENNNVDAFMRKKISLRGSNDHYKKVPDLSLFRTSENKEILLDNFDSNEFKSLCSVIIPMLYDSWVEFSPQEKFDENSEFVLKESVGELLSILLKILLFLYEVTQTLEDTTVEHWFLSNYGPGFKKSFTFNFPYLPTTNKNLTKSSNIGESGKSFNAYVTQNLIICYLAYSFKVVDKNSNLESKIENYISDALTMKEEIEILVKVVKAAIYASKHKTPNIILSKVVEVYSVISKPEFRQSLSKMLLSIALEDNERIQQKDNSIMNWMKSLPDQLCKSQIYVEEIETILKLINTPIGADVLREIEARAEKILDNLQGIKVEGVAQIEGQKMIADILYRCSRNVLVEILKILEDKIYQDNLKNYMIEVFSQKLANYLELNEGVFI